MDQLRTKCGYSRGLQWPTVPMSAIGLVKHTQRFHHFARQKLPPACKQQSSVLVLVCDLSHSSATRADVTIMPIEDENLAESETRNVAHHVGKVYGHDLGPKRESTAKRSAIPEMMMESDPSGLWGPWNSRLPRGRIAKRERDIRSATSNPTVS